MQFYIITYTDRPIGESGESCKSDYNLDHACPKCGTGAKLNGNLRVKGISNVRKDFFETLDGDYLISGQLYEKLKDLHPEFELSAVVDIGNQELEYFHLYSHTILPRFNKKSSGFVIEDQCPHCLRNGYFNDAKIGDLDRGIPTEITPVKLCYEESNFEPLLGKNILQTWECLGLSNRRPHDRYAVRFARPWIIVSQDLKQIFERQGLSAIRYEEIKIE